MVHTQKFTVQDCALPARSAGRRTSRRAQALLPSCVRGQAGGPCPSRPLGPGMSGTAAFLLLISLLAGAVWRRRLPVAPHATACARPKPMTAARAAVCAHRSSLPVSNESVFHHALHACHPCRLVSAPTGAVAVLHKGERWSAACCAALLVSTGSLFPYATLVRLASMRCAQAPYYMGSCTPGAATAQRRAAARCAASTQVASGRAGGLASGRQRAGAGALLTPSTGTGSFGCGVQQEGDVRCKARA